MMKDFVVTDEVRQKKLGMNLGTVVEEVEKGWIRRFCQSIGDSNPIYTNESYAKETVHGGIIAPPTFFFAFEPTQRDGISIIFDEPITSGAHVEDEWEFFQHIRPGDVITAECRLVNLVEKEGKTGRLVFAMAETIFTNQRDEVVVKARITTVIYPEGRKDASDK